MLCAVSVKPGSPAGARLRVVAAAEVPLPVGDSETAALRSVMGTIDKNLPTLAVLARSQYRVRVMPEPTVPERDMTATLRWSVSTEGDESVDGVNLAWLRIPTETLLPSKPKQLYAITTPADALNTRLAIWRQVGVRPKVVDVRETALRNLAGAVQGDHAGLALLQADEDGVCMVFTHQGSLFMNRFMEQSLAEVGAPHSEAGRQAQARIGQQLARSIDVVERTYPFMPISHVVIAPGPGQYALAEALGELLAIPVEPLDLSRVFDLSAVPALAKDAGFQSRAFVALGAALRPA